MHDITHNTINTPNASLEHGVSWLFRYRKVLFWLFLACLMAVTWYFSRTIETRTSDSAASFFSGVARVITVELSQTGAVPAHVTLPVGGSIEFVVVGEGKHNLAEQRSSSRRGDARISSGEFGAGESFLLQFNTPGEFYLYDRLNEAVSIDIQVN